MSQYLIDRPRLIATLDSVPAGGTAVLVAPPGSGKSVLASQWVRGQNACWVSLTGRHDDAVGLARDLAVALHRVDKAFDVAVGDLAVNGGARLGPRFLDALVSEIAEMAAPVALVLDDAHRVTNPAVLDDFGELLGRLPSNCRAVLSTRWDLPVGVARLRAQGRLVEVRWDDLALDVPEGQLMLQQSAARSVDPQHVKALVAKTQGWAAGLRLAGLSLQRVSDPAAFVDGFAGDDRLVGEYLTQEVLRSVDPHVRSFLLRTSVLETLSPDLCDAVTGQAGSRAVLAELVERCIFTTEVEGRPGEFCYHHLFADLLRYNLRLEVPNAERDCRRQAASWLLAHGQHRQGVEQLIAADDHPEAFEIIATQGHLLFERGETATLVRGLTVIRDRERQPTPRLLINLMAGQIGAEQFGGAAQSYRTLARRNDLTSGERLAADSMATLLGYDDLALPKMKRLALGVLETLPRIDRDSVPDFLGIGGADSCEAFAGFSAGLAELYAGEVGSGAKWFERVVAMPGFEYPIWRIATLGALGFTRAVLGQLTEAEGHANAALQTAQEVGAMEHVDSSYAQLASAIIRLDRMHLGRAGIHLAAAADILQRCHRSTESDFLRILDIRQLAATEGPGQALELLRSSPPSGPRRPIISRSWKALEVQLLVRCDASGQARAVLDATPQLSPGARFDVLFAQGDRAGARAALASWKPDSQDPRSGLQRALRLAALQHSEGHPGVAGTTIAEAAGAAEVEGMLTPFLEVPLARTILRSSAPARPLHRVKELLSTAASDKGRATANEQLVEPLTVREIAVLEYLPTRLSNSEMADALFISVNTLKTHLGSIYRKLGINDRSEVVRHAASLGLI
ncbi:MAG: LuxR C-terminal-related transcriptional regulator [Ornithinimicrobium sp.]